MFCNDPSLNFDQSMRMRNGCDILFVRLCGCHMTLIDDNKDYKSKCWTSTNIFIAFYAPTFFEGVFIVGAKRTAFGTFGGTLKNVTGTQLQVHACKATLEAAGVRPDQVDSVIIGNVLVVSIPCDLSTLNELLNENTNYFSHHNQMEFTYRDTHHYYAAFLSIGQH